MKNAKNFFKLLLRALKGENHDYTEGLIADAVILLAVPMILELGLESVFAVVDMFFVSRLGPTAIASVGLTESVITIVYSVAIGISTGASAVVARRVGEKRPELAAHAGAQSILFSLALSLIFSVIGVVYASDLLRLMEASPEVIQDGSVFMRWMLGGSPIIVLLFLINGIFRGAGNAAMAMRSLWVASGINILLCPVLIHFFGLQGAAFATIAGRSCGVLFQCSSLFRGKGLLKFRALDFHFDFPMIKSIFQVSWPASFQFLIGSGSWILLTRLVAEMGGTAASAGYQIAFRNFVFFILPAWGLSNAAATLVGQNLGAHHPERAEESVWTTAKYSAILMAFVTVLFLALAGPIVRVFSEDPQVIEFGIQALRAIGAGYIFYGVGMVFTASFNGAGDTKTPTWINFCCFWLFQTPLAYFLARHTDLSATGAVLAIPISHAVLAVVAWLFFRRGKWKQTRV